MAPVATPVKEAQESAAQKSDARAITFRAVLLGTGLASLIAGLAAYNDYVINNGFIVACYLPVGFFFCMFVLAVCVNGPLRKWLPRMALSSGELAVITVMGLTACSIPTQGLLRSFLPTLVHPFHHGVNDLEFWKAFTSLGLPHWLYPVHDIATGRASTVIKWYYSRVPEGQPIPYGAWIVPLLVWGIFLVSMFGVLVSSAMLIFPQWAQNERLAFPIAQVELALISEPERDRALAPLFRSRGFWIAAIAVFFVHSVSCLHGYFPKVVPDIPLTYNFENIMTGFPWRYVTDAMKTNTVFFLFVGMAYFIQARVGFSIWGTFFVLQIVRVFQESQLQYFMGQNAIVDQHLGASVVFIGGVLWVGRHYWRKVFAESLGRYRLPVFILLAGLIGMVGWLMMLGVSLPMAMLIVGFILLCHLVAARVVAETGLPIFRCFATPGQVYTRFSPAHVTGRDVYFAQVFSMNGAFTTRESVMPFVQHGLWVFDAVQPKSPSRKHLGWLIVWTLMVSFGVGCFSSLHAFYTNVFPLTDRVPQEKIDEDAEQSLTSGYVVDVMDQYARGTFDNSPSYHPAVFVAVGAGITACLSFLSLRYASWPFLPVGYVICTAAYYIDWSWFSIFLGWLAKVLVLRFGGAKMFQNGKPLFIGLIAGEVLAAAAWLVVNLVLAAMHYNYLPAVFYPQ